MLQRGGGKKSTSHIAAVPKQLASCGAPPAHIRASTKTAGNPHVCTSTRHAAWLNSWPAHGHGKCMCSRQGKARSTRGYKHQTHSMHSMNSYSTSERTGMQSLQVPIKVQCMLREVQRDLMEVVITGGAGHKVQHGGVLHAVYVDGQHAYGGPHHALAVVEELLCLCVQREVGPAYMRALPQCSCMRCVQGEGGLACMHGCNLHMAPL